MSIKEAFNKVKTFVDVYKIWIFIVALFGTNGIQAYFNSDKEAKSEPEVKVEEVKPKFNNQKLLNSIKLIMENNKCTCNCSGSVLGHEIEHHGGR